MWLVPIFILFYGFLQCVSFNEKDIQEYAAYVDDIVKTAFLDIKTNPEF